MFFNSYIVLLRTELPTHESLKLILILSKHQLPLVTHSDAISKKLMLKSSNSPAPFPLL